MATAKQLAALKKGREARKKKIAVNAKSQATKKAPSKRLKKRREKNLKGPAGYFPNPTKRKSTVKYVVQVKATGNRIGYLTPKGTLDTEPSKASKLSLKGAEEKAQAFFDVYKKMLVWVKVVKASDLKK